MIGCFDMDSLFLIYSGHVQGTIVMEAVLDHVTTFLGKENPDDLKELNLYRDGQVSC